MSSLSLKNENLQTKLNSFSSTSCNEKDDNLNLLLNENHKKLIEPHKIIIKDYELTYNLTDIE